MLPYITGDFRAVSDPELKFSAKGMAYCKVRGVADQKKKNEQSGEWEDDKIIWVNITAFGKTAENMAESVYKGVLMTVNGKVDVSEYETKDGEKRSSVNIVANSLGVALAFDSAKVIKAERTQAQAAPQPAANPWSTPTDNQTDEPPFSNGF